MNFKDYHIDIGWITRAPDKSILFEIIPQHSELFLGEGIIGNPDLAMQGDNGALGCASHLTRQSSGR